jgi:uncharacterized membrane protein YeiH
VNKRLLLSLLLGLASVSLLVMLPNRVTTPPTAVTQGIEQQTKSSILGIVDVESPLTSVTAVSKEPVDSGTVKAIESRTVPLMRLRNTNIVAVKNGALDSLHFSAFSELMDSQWFYGLDLIGTAAFGVSGFLRGLQRKYDLFGCFILSLLPAVGGGTLRDILIGGVRSPPFIFRDDAYLAVVAGVVIVGSLFARLLHSKVANRRGMNTLFLVCDSVGLATFTIIGAKVAVECSLSLWWIPISSAITCAGGGIILDVVTGKEPRAFLGDFYEEIAIIGALLLIGGLFISEHINYNRWIIVAIVAFTWCFVFLFRLAVVRYNLQSWRPGD